MATIEITDNTIDLFEYPELLPQEVRNILEKFEDYFSYTYQDCNRLVKQLNAIGYTCEYGLDASPYNLTKLK
jgi:hypothetical protein